MTETITMNEAKNIEEKRLVEERKTWVDTMTNIIGAAMAETIDNASDYSTIDTTELVNIVNADEDDRPGLLNSFILNYLKELPECMAREFMVMHNYDIVETMNGYNKAKEELDDLRDCYRGTDKYMGHLY